MDSKFSADAGDLCDNTAVTAFLLRDSAQTRRIMVTY